MSPPVRMLQDLRGYVLAEDARVNERIGAVDEPGEFLALFWDEGRFLLQRTSRGGKSGGTLSAYRDRNRGFGYPGNTYCSFSSFS